MRSMPYPLNEACEARREQAQRFMRDLMATRVEDMTVIGRPTDNELFGKSGEE